MFVTTFSISENPDLRQLWYVCIVWRPLSIEAFRNNLKFTLCRLISILLEFKKNLDWLLVCDCEHCSQLVDNNVPRSLNKKNHSQTNKLT